VSLCEGGEYWIDDLVSLQAGPSEVLRLQRTTAEADGQSTAVGLWQDTGQAGAVDVDTTRAVLGGFEVEVVDSWSSDKIGEPNIAARSSRAKRSFARAWAPLVEDGRVYIKRAPWSSTVLAECDQFPHGRHDDCVDALSGAMKLLQAESGTSLLEAMTKVRRAW
jgi:predicted phage terminase large subunit-like protein